MRFLADENFPGAAVAALRRASLVVDWALEQTPGGSDVDVLERAVASGAVILTFDKDFGDLAHRENSSGGFGVILFRLPMPGAPDAGTTLAELVRSRDDWEGHFSVIEPGRVRMRALAPRQNE